MRGRFSSEVRPRLISVRSCMITQLFEDSLPAAEVVSTAPKGMVVSGFALPQKKSQKSPS